MKRRDGRRTLLRGLSFCSARWRTYGRITRRQTMRKAAILVLIAAFAPLAAAAKGGSIKRLDSIPDAYWGTWAPAVASCKDGGAEAIVLAAKAYTDPLGKCDVASVSETPSQKGPTYS